MMNIRDENGMLILPDLIEIPVYRDDFISQQQVDELCKLLWEEGSDLVKNLLSSIDDSVTFSRLHYQSMCTIGFDLRDIGIFLNKKIEPLSDIQMCDFLYEVERRVRAVGAYPEFKPVGKSIAPKPQGPFPEDAVVLPYIFEGTPEVSFAISDPVVNGGSGAYPHQYRKNYKALCEEHPEQLFTFGEEFRRGGEYTEASSFVEDALYKKE